MQNRKLIPLMAASEYIERLAEKYNLTKDVKDLLLQQMKTLKDTYGEEIPKDDFLMLIGKQLELLKSGNIRTPVDIDEFLVSPEYLNLANTIRPKVREELNKIFNEKNHCYEIILAGSLRWGKTYLASAGMAYCIYRLSCLYSPQTHYRLSPGSEIVAVFQSISEDKARRNFREFKGMIDNSKYFTENFPPQGKTKNYIQFPHNILVKPVSTSNNSIISENVILSFQDEMNFFRTQRGKKSLNEDHIYENLADRLYQTMKQRMQNQFKDMATGDWPGKMFLASSANYEGDFISEKIEEAKTNDRIHVSSFALFEVKTEGLSGKKFWVQMPDEWQSGKILYEKPDDPLPDDIIEIPIEYLDQFEDDLINSIRNVAGKPVTRVSKFIPSDSLHQCIRNYYKYYEGQQIFSTQETCINEVYDVSSLINKPFVDAIKHFGGHFHCHLDMALSQDSAGLALGATVGSKKLTYEETEYEEETKQERYAPIYAVFGMLRINPPERGEISIDKMEELLHILTVLLPTFYSFSYDRRYSATFKQNMQKLGLSTKETSMDKNTIPYFEFKNSVVQDRVLLPDHEAYKEELKYLKLHADTEKIDHPPDRSKDIADAVTGVVYKLSNMKKTYKITGTPYTLAEMRSLAEKHENETRGRPRVTDRPRSNNRPKRWRRR